MKDSTLKYKTHEASWASALERTVLRICVDQVVLGVRERKHSAYIQVDIQMEGAPTPVVVNEPGDHHDLSDLPPGFRFHPTDEEIITHYLMEKVTKTTFSAKAIGEVDLNKCEPWDLPSTYSNLH
ncbi:hypothetical protein RJ639_014148 [Escallonia herrerae]|uniref:NAC domain-containing protein n=1 Tax=Escallonia herrerae TaxID=1293975 RepID=A0AA88VHX1_9ASTE|nr:hypothetical protein RJ639_014148 [Escallonia herrerae]